MALVSIKSYQFSYLVQTTACHLNIIKNLFNKSKSWRVILKCTVLLINAVYVANSLLYHSLFFIFYFYFLKFCIISMFIHENVNRD